MGASEERVPRVLVGVAVGSDMRHGTDFLLTPTELLFPVSFESHTLSHSRSLSLALSISVSPREFFVPLFASIELVVVGGGDRSVEP